MREALKQLQVEGLVEIRPRVGTFVLRVLERNIRDSGRVLKAGNLDAYPPLVHEFHETLLLGVDNRKLEAHYRGLMNQLAYHRMVLKQSRIRGGSPSTVGWQSSSSRTPPGGV